MYVNDRKASLPNKTIVKITVPYRLTALDALSTVEYGELLLSERLV